MVTFAKWGYTGLAALTVLGSIGSVGVAARLAQEGCCDSYDLCDDVPEFNKLYAELKNTSKEIDRIFLEGKFQKKSF